MARREVTQPAGARREISQPEERPETILQKIARPMGLGTTVENIQLATANPLMRTITKLGRKQTDDLFKQSQEINQQIRSETDPQRKQQLIEQSRAIGQKLDDISGGLTKAESGYMGFGGIKDEDLDKSNLGLAARRGTTSALEVGSYLAPMAKELQWTGKGLVGAGKRVASATARGTIAGGSQGAAESIRQDESLQEGAARTTGSAVAGGVVGGGLQSAFEVANGVRFVWNSIPDALRKQARNDIVASLNPNKTIRGEAKRRGIEIADEYILGNYPSDPIAGEQLAQRKTQESAIKFRRMFKDNKNTIDYSKIVDDVVSAQKKKAASDAEIAALDQLADFQKRFAKENYGGTNINVNAAIDQKITAGQNGYGDYGNKLDTMVGETYANLERALRSEILSAAGPKKKLAEQLLREQEAAMFMGSVMNNAQIARNPMPTSRMIGRFFFPSSLAAETVGKGAEKAVSQTAAASPGTTNVLPIPSGAKVTPAERQSLPVQSVVNPIIRSLQ